jgi:phage-related protein
MGIVLPTSFKNEIERPQAQDDALWLLEIELDRGAVGRPPVLMRICDGQAQLTWPARAAITGYLANGAASTGATAVAIDSGTGAIAPGDTCTFASHATTYTVVSYAAGILSLTPALTAGVPDNNALTFTAQTTTWEPFPFTFSPIEQTQEGDLSSIDLSVDNTARTLMRFLHDGHGLEGNRATLFLVYRNGLAITYPAHEFQRFDLEVQLAGATDEAVTFRLGMPNWFAIQSPSARYIPKKCRWQFGSPECGYVINEFAAFVRCSKLIDACVVRGDDMVARGLPAIHPGNFGGHPGIPTQR